jgi:hypothetical protein
MAALWMNIGGLASDIGALRKDAAFLAARAGELESKFRHRHSHRSSTKRSPARKRDSMAGQLPRMRGVKLHWCNGRSSPKRTPRSRSVAAGIVLGDHGRSSTDRLIPNLTVGGCGHADVANMDRLDTLAQQPRGQGRRTLLVDEYLQAAVTRTG